MKPHPLRCLPLRAFTHIAIITALAVAGQAQITTTGIRGIVRNQSGANYVWSHHLGNILNETDLEIFDLQRRL